ncbi:lengsin [Anguilla rostrata]|uniref:lengsin n=1 Tax=Anguilla rostrata TaxID=7938 RepID=UPI0030D4509C
MNVSENSSIKETTQKKTDQIDGNSITLGRKKGVKVSGKYAGPMDWEREPSAAVGQSYVSTRHPPDTLISNSPPLQRASSSSQAHMQQHPREDNNKAVEDWDRESVQGAADANISKQTLEELKSLLRESSLLSVQGKEGGNPGSTYSYLKMTKPEGRQEEVNNMSFTTFKPQNQSSQKAPRSRKDLSSFPISNPDSPGSYRSDVSVNRPSGLRQPIAECATWRDVLMSQVDNDKDVNIQTQRSQSFFHYDSTIGHIKQKIAQEEVNLVRFEATDLHGVSRSKTVPARFFQEKALYGVPMPRSYLELTLSPKNNEVDHASAANFNSDVLLIPDLPTFRILPWANQTARVICDSCSVTGYPLRTSPRFIAKQLLGQLQSLGFSLHSSFTYECCVFGVPEKINSKTLFFPAATLLSNNDLPFFQQLVSSMYYMGADVDSFSSASGPGQMEISFQPEFGIAAADNAFTFRTGIKEMAHKHGYIASFFTDDGFYNSGVLSHSLWDANGRKNLFYLGGGELSEIGRKWLAGLLHHSAALSCVMAPGVSCRRQIAKDVKDPKHTIYATCGFNDNSCAFNVKFHGGKGMHIDNKLGSAMANPYLVLATTVAAGLDGIKRNLTVDLDPTKTLAQQKQFSIPVKLEDALVALEEDHIIRAGLGDSFVQYFMALKRYEIETQEMDAERNKCLEYFI